MTYGPAARRSPSADAARIFTLLAAFWLWFLLPVAVHYQRNARREVAQSGGMYEWPRTIWNRPILLWLIALTTGLALVLLLAAAGAYGP